MAAINLFSTVLVGNPPIPSVCMTVTQVTEVVVQVTWPEACK